MFRGRGEIRKQLTDIIPKFKEKGATTPKKHYPARTGVADAV